METRTVNSILREKMLDTLVRASWRDMLSAFIATLGSIALVIVLVYPEKSWELAQILFHMNSHAIPKIATAFTLIYNRKFLASLAMSGISQMNDWYEELHSKQDDATSYVRGIPIPELVDYIFETKGFKIKDTMERFAISRGTYDFLIEGFDLSGVFIRGENNARVLNPDFSRTDIVSILWKADVEGFKTLSREESKGSYTHEPSMPSIIARLSPEKHGGFEIRPLNTVSFYPSEAKGEQTICEA